MKLWHVVSVVALVALNTGCGSDKDPEPQGQAATVNQAAAKQNAQSAIAAALAAKQGQGASSVSSFVGLGSGAFSLLTPSAPGQGAQTTALLTAPVGAFAPDEVGVSCTDTSCTFDHYAPAGAYTVDGSMSWGGGHLVADLTVSMSQNGMSFEFETTADLEVTDSSLDGTVTSKGRVVVPQAQQYGSSGEVSWDSSVEYDELTFANGQPTGGSMSVHASMQSGDQSYVGDVTVSFP